MSREVKRVPLDFDAPLNEVWAGYCKPTELIEDQCGACAGGYTWARDWLAILCDRIGMLADDIGEQDRGRPMHPWLADDGHPPCDGGVFDPSAGWWIRQPKVMRPTRDILALVSGLTGESETALLHPMHGTDGYRIALKVIEAAGLDPDVWGLCAACGGRGCVEKYPGQSAEAELWKPTDPPRGDGWQLWTTVTEGSPMSPVFAGADDLAAWMVDHGEASSMEVARRFITVGWAPSGAATPETGVMTGVEFVGRAVTP